MKTNNISFNAKLDHSTRTLINTAKENGLNTQNLENTINKVLPGNIISTCLAHNSKGDVVGLLSMGTGGKINKIYADKMIIEPKIIKDKKTFAHIWKTYTLSQKLIDKITSSLKNYKV